MSRLLLVLSITFNIHNVYGATPPSDIVDIKHPASEQYLSQSEQDFSPVSLFRSKSRRLLQCSTATIPLPPHGYYFQDEGSVRGYYFQAPTQFAITGISIPTDASTGLSTAAIIRFNSGPPPIYDATTNDFTQLGYYVNRAETTIATNCICIQPGEYIGVLGYRGAINSYSFGPRPSSSIDGNSITLIRLGMQASLVTNAPKDIYTSTSPIGRVGLEYTTCPVVCPCLDVPACADNADCTDLNTVCDAEGQCVCDNGYIEQNDFCVDINECDDPTICGNNAQCNNTPGLYICECDEGYKDLDPAVPGTNCQDVDECAELLHDCGINAECTNLHPGYGCSCIDGFVGDPSDECRQSCTSNKDCAAGYVCCRGPIRFCHPRGWRPGTAAQSILEAPIVEEKPFTHDTYMYGYILFIGLIAFILVNNVFVCWCVMKKKNNLQYQQCQVEVVNQ